MLRLSVEPERRWRTPSPPELATPEEDDYVGTGGVADFPQAPGNAEFASDTGHSFEVVSCARSSTDQCAYSHDINAIRAIRRMTHGTPNPDAGIPMILGSRLVTVDPYTPFRDIVRHLQDEVRRESQRETRRQQEEIDWYRG